MHQDDLQLDDNSGEPCNKHNVKYEFIIHIDVLQLYLQ